MERLQEHLQVRLVFTWGTYGKDGKQPLKRVKLADMSDAHIEAILATQPQIYKEPTLPALFNYELGYRAGIGLEVEYS